MPEFTVEQATIQRVTTIDTKGGGFAILVTTTNAIHDDVLTRLMRGRGSVMRLTFEDPQLTLMPGDDANAGLPEPSPPAHWEAVSGDVVKAHAYESTTGDERCDVCGHATSHECHEASKIAAAGDKLIASALEDTGPNDAPTEDQEEARTALASRSRRKGPRADVS